MIDLDEILKNICYTKLVYLRINKKLKLNLSEYEIEELILTILKESSQNDCKKIGKNFYITDNDRKIRITINSNTFRVITADRVL